MKKLLTDRVFRLALIGFLLTTALGLGVARLVLENQQATYPTIAGGFVLLFVSLTAIAVHAQRSVGRERASCGTRTTRCVPRWTSSSRTRRCSTRS